MSLVQKCIQSITFQGFNAKANNPGQLTHHRPWSLLYWPFDIVSRRVEQTTWSSYGWFQGKILYEANKIGRIITKHLASPKWAGNECQWESKYLQEGSPIKNNTKKVKRRRGGGGLLTKRTSERYTVPNTTAQVWVPGRGPKRWEGTGSDLATTLGAAPSRGRQRLKPAFNKTDLGIVAPCPESFKKPEVCRIKSIWGQYKQCHGWKDSEPEGRIKSINSWW